jgi:hypothetical protein
LWGRERRSAWCRSGEYGALTRSGVEQWLGELGRDVLGEGRRIYPHLFLHSFVTEQLRRGTQPILVAKIVGHSSLELVNRVYQHLSVSDAHEGLMRPLAEDRWHQPVSRRRRAFGAGRESRRGCALVRLQAARAAEQRRPVPGRPGDA